MLSLSDIPIYKQIYNDILVKIKNNTFTNKLPSEKLLSFKYNVNRHTIRHALKLLKDNGHIYTKKGSGHYIKSINLIYGITNKSNFSSKLASLGYKPKTKLLKGDIITPDKNVAEKLKLPNDSKAVQLKLLRFADDTPIQISYSYFDAYIYNDILNFLDIEPFSIYDTLKKCYENIEITKIYTVVKARNETEECRRLLKIKKNTPIISVETLSKDQHNDLVEYGISYFRSDMCEIKIDLI